MTDTYLEQHPLLCDECTDEELHNIESVSRGFQRRLRLKPSTGRARSHVIGAAAIITRWPDHLSSLLTYWWIGIGMIAITVFVIYNSIVAIAIFPQTNTKLFKNITHNKLHENSPTLNVYMHVFISNDDELNLDYFLPYVEGIVIKYSEFKYNFIVVKNDITQDINDLGDKQNNEMALNSLWTDSFIKIQRKQYNNFTVKFISLTKYLNCSPIKKYWRLLPNQFIGFMTRVISIWEKGGVAFNPLILTPNTPNSIYLEKLYSLLDNFQSKHIITKRKKILKKSKVKLNNIRDIINNLQNDEADSHIFPDSLSEAENVQTVAIAKRSVKAKLNANSLSSGQYMDISRETTTENVDKNIKPDTKQINNIFQENINNDQTYIPTKNHKVQKFLDFLFHTNPENLTVTLSKFENSTEDIIIFDNNVSTLNLKVNNTLSKDIEDSKIPPAKSIKTKTISIENYSKKLTIDLKGQLIATETPCHAFIGTIFSNILHYTEEDSLSNFISTELSVFCKGSLSTCNGVEVILL